MKKISIYLSMLMAMFAVAFSSCDDDFAQPPMILPEGGLGTGTWDSPKSALQVLEGASGTEIWITGYIVGWIDTNISNAMNEETCKFTTPATVSTNILMAMNPEETDYSKCIPVQLPTGAIRKALNLVDNPNILGLQVTLKGNCERYFGTNGVKSPTAYNWGDKGIEEAPVVTENLKFEKASTVEAGKTYLMVSGGKAATIVTGNYGYLKTVDVAPVNGVIEMTNQDCSFTFEAAEGGYYIKQSNGKYLYLTGSYSSFNVDASPVDGSIFKVEAAADGTWKITNVAMGKYIQYDSSYGSYGAYADERGALPELYVLK